MVHMDKIQHYSKRLWYRLVYLYKRFGEDRCSENAAALTYMSLFALVPLLTVFYAMASAIPAFKGLEGEIQGLLFTHLMPDTSSEIEQYLNDFSRQAKNLTGVGIGFLVATAILMLRNIEKSFNHIWRTGENRGPVSSFLLYWAVLSLAPMTIGLALAISAYLASFAVMFEDLDVLGAGSALLTLSPLLLSTAGFTLIYVAVPNCRVPFRHAVFGGVIAALSFNTARALFTDLVVGSNYTFIYGAFAAVPLFLLWIYLSWIIVLMGGILVHSLSAFQSHEQAFRPTVLKALDVLYLFWQRQKSGKTVREIELLNGKQEVTQGLDSETWRLLRDRFISKKLITQDQKGNYVLSRDLNTISFWQLKEWINEELPLGREDIETHLPWQQKAYALLGTQRQQQHELLATSIAELYEQ